MNEITCIFYFSPYFVSLLLLNRLSYSAHIFHKLIKLPLKNQGSLEESKNSLVLGFKHLSAFEKFRDTQGTGTYSQPWEDEQLGYLPQVDQFVWAK